MLVELSMSLGGRWGTRLRRRLARWNDPVERELLRISKIPRFQAGTTRLFGQPMEFVDSASFVYMYREIFQRAIYAFECASEAPRIVDGGANIGLSIIYHKRRFPRARVIGIEADTAVFTVLQGNMRQLGVDDVTLHPVALWDQEGELQFGAQGADAGRVAAAGGCSEFPQVRVPSALLSKFLDEPVDLLKLDIEGAEYRVLTEASGALDRVKRIFVEYHSFRNEPQLLADLLGLLRAGGFRVQIQSVGVPRSPFLRQEGRGEMDMQLNIFGVRL
jgi:FkbM family methyltransferase